jgi:hypothetical protein
MSDMCVSNNVFSSCQEGKKKKTEIEMLTPAKPDSTRYQQSNSHDPPKTFPLDATWPQLIGHCQSEHPDGCNALERLNPAEVQELRQRLKTV